MQQQGQTFSPESSIPGTPAEPDDDFNMAMYMNSNMNMGNMNFGFANDLGLDYCIDEPAKRLYSPNGGSRNQSALQQQFANFGLGGNGQFGNNQDLIARYRQQQMMAMNGMNNGAAGVMMAEENKPFRCPVIGCEKAYKNQNGLK
jgi:transcription factor SFP1